LDDPHADGSSGGDAHMAASQTKIGAAQLESVRARRAENCRFGAACGADECGAKLWGDTILSASAAARNRSTIGKATNPPLSRRNGRGQVAFGISTHRRRV